MGRVISHDKKLGIAEARLADPSAIGPMLGELVIAGNVPVVAVAGLLSVSEPTIYRWMYGHSKPTDKDKVVKIKRLLTVLRKAKRAKDLPLQGNTKERTSCMAALINTHKPVLRSE